MPERIAFIGGGNMASAILGGMIQQGASPEMIDVAELLSPPPRLHLTPLRPCI